MKRDRYFIDSAIEEDDDDFQRNWQHFAVFHSGSTVDNTQTDWFPQVKTSPTFVAQLVQHNGDNNKNHPCSRSTDFVPDLKFTSSEPTITSFPTDL
eukprot:11494139-Ditylum_brightwellii.AAC.1